MMEERVEAGEVSVEVKSGIEELEVKVVEAGSECEGKEDGCNDVVANGEDESDNSYVLVSGSDGMVDDMAERGNVSEVSVESSDREVLGESGFKEDKVEGLDGGQKAEIEEDGKTSVAVENGVSLLSSDAEEIHVGESNQDEMKTDVVENIEIFDEESDQGEVENTLEVEEPYEVEDSNKLEDVQETVNVTPSDQESKPQQIIIGGAVENGDAGIGISNPNAEEKLDSETEFKESSESEHATEELEKEINEDYYPDKKENQDSEDVEDSNKLEDVQETVNVSPSDQESKPQQIINGGAVENGDAGIGISNPNAEEKLDSEIEFKESSESEHATEELEKEINEDYYPDNKENQDSEDVEELEKECNEETSPDKNENQESEDLVPTDARVNLMELNQAGHISGNDESLSGKKVIVNKEPHLSEEGRKLFIKSEVSADVNENEKCDRFIPIDELHFNREDQNNSANVLPVESNAEFANAVIPNEHNDFRSSKISSCNGNDNDMGGNNIDSNANSGPIEKSEAASAILTEQEERELEYETQVEANDNETAEAEQTLLKDILLNSVDQEKKELASEINDGLHSYPGTECGSGPSLDGNDHDLVDDVEVVEQDTEAGDSNVPTDNEWPELSYYNRKKKINTESKSEVHGSQESEIGESEGKHVADRDGQEVHNGSPEDANLTGHKKEVVDASLAENSEKACPDSGTSKENNHTSQSTAWADYNDQTDGVSSPSVRSTCSHSHCISDGAVSAANLENGVATSESGSRDGETNLNGKIEASKVETSSEEDSSPALVESEVQIRPFFFLIKVPRLEDDEIREHIKFAQQDVDEKTKLRDSYKVPIQTKRDICMGFSDELEAMKLKEKAARDNLKAKRKEIDAAQAVLDKVNNAMTVEDIDASIHIMEHRMQHETVPLSEEKQLMREIKRLKHFKEQLSSSIGTQEELQEALDQKDQIRDHLKSLKRELNSIRSDVQRAELVTKDAKKKCFDEYAELNKLQLEFKAADGVRQEAYMSLVSLRRELAQKNKFFRMYKDTEKLANDYALSGDKKSLHSLCVNQVETVMELWNTDDQFRNDYIKCNARSTHRRLKTLDGRSLGLNEEPPSLPYIRNDRINHSEVVTNSLSQFPPLEETKIHVPSVAEKIVNELNEPVMDSLDKKVAKRQPKSTSAVSEVSTVPSLELTPEAIEEVQKAKEEEELAKKAEENRKKEEEARMMEQLQLEERAKAKEALERKKRMAERAQARAKLRAKKEAEEREKEREKRLRKKEKRKDGKEKDFIAVNTDQAEASKEANPAEKLVTVSKRHHKPSHYVKTTKTNTMPLNLRNRNKRKMQMWMWMGVAALAAVAVVLVWFGYLSEQERVGH